MDASLIGILAVEICVKMVALICCSVEYLARGRSDNASLPTSTDKVADHTLAS